MPALAPDGGAALVLARGLAVAAMLSVWGILAFRVMVAPRCLPRMAPEPRATIERGLLRLLRASLLAAGVGLAAWLCAVTADLAEPQSLADWPDGLDAVLFGTVFGRVLLLQVFALLATGALLAGRPGEMRWRVAAPPGAAATILEAGHSHAYAMAHGPSLLLASDVVHLTAAGTWLGGLLPLLLVTRVAPPRDAAMAARWFSPPGQICVAAMAASALVQGWTLVGSVTALVHTAYGWTALLKLALFGALFGFAMLNRYQLAPALLGTEAARARRVLLRSLAWQTGCGGAILMAAALLSQLQPGMKMPP